MTRRTDPQPGMTAQWSSTCDRCHQPITRNVSRIFFHRGNPVHVECASGGGDE